MIKFGLEIRSIIHYQDRPWITLVSDWEKQELLPNPSILDEVDVIEVLEGAVRYVNTMESQLRNNSTQRWTIEYDSYHMTDEQILLWKVCTLVYRNCMNVIDLWLYHYQLEAILNHSRGFSSIYFIVNPGYIYTFSNNRMFITRSYQVLVI